MTLIAFGYVGELAGLGTAACWSVCSLAFTAAGRRIGAMAVNQLRIPIAILLLASAHRILFGSFWPADISRQQATLLAVSGVLGLTLGDLCLFRCFVLIGPRLGTLLMTIAPVLTALLAWPILHERLSPSAAAGIALTIAGILWVLNAHPRHAPEAPSSRSLSIGIVLGILGAAGQALGLVFAKLGMRAADSAANVALDGADGALAPIDPLSATLVRMVAGAAGIWLIAALRGNIVSTIRTLADQRALAYTAIGAVLGPFMGVWLSLVSVSHTSAGVAATLMGTVPIIMLPLARIAYGDRPGAAVIAGTLVAFAGVAYLFLAGAP